MSFMLMYIITWLNLMLQVNILLFSKRSRLIMMLLFLIYKEYNKECVLQERQQHETAYKICHYSRMTVHL